MKKMGLLLLALAVVVTFMIILQEADSEKIEERVFPSFSSLEEWTAYHDSITQYDTTGQNKHVIFMTNIDGCSCSKHSVFYIAWDSPINTNNFIDALLAADKDSLLLCDCDNDDSSQVGEVVAGIMPGFRDFYWSIRGQHQLPVLDISLKREMYLYSGEINPKLRDILEENRGKILGDKTFEVR